MFYFTKINPYPTLGNLIKNHDFHVKLHFQCPISPRILKQLLDFISELKYKEEKSTWEQSWCCHCVWSEGLTKITQNKGFLIQTKDFLHILAKTDLSGVKGLIPFVHKYDKM